MKNSPLNIYAGQTARQHLAREGLQNLDVKHMLAASGGPKWMVLFGLDKYLNEHFFSAQQSLNIMGSSAGAMRACCYAQQAPSSAIQRFADAYTHTRYAKKPSPADITASAHVLLQQLFGEEGQQEVLNNRFRHLNIVTARCHGLAAREHSVLQGIGMLGGFALNRLSRRWLDIPFERVIFFNGQPMHFDEQHALRTRYISLNEKNLYLAALASGSIPMVMEGIYNIPGAPAGCYRDGGIVDYHFDVDPGEGLCLYPHFNNAPRAAWFDKFGHRKINTSHYHNTLILAPSESFIRSLPYGKIPDRKDFAELDDADRERFWRTVQSESARLAEAFHERLEKQNWQDVMPMEALG
ncbi:MAG TPA: patatin-like phospholipase family protein [Pseudomonadales bacterium]|nr:patatin-like phospholipase family protein [Pseudomonadales bacterium]